METIVHSIAQGAGFCFGFVMVVVLVATVVTIIGMIIQEYEE